MKIDIEKENEMKHSQQSWVFQLVSLDPYLDDPGNA